MHEDIDTDIYPAKKMDIPVGGSLEFTSRTTLNWSEHCTECVMPECYTTCGFYSPRADLKCRRFEHGIQEVETESGSTFKKIVFKKWAKLESKGDRKLKPVAVSKVLESVFSSLGAVIQKLPVGYGRRRFLFKALQKLKDKPPILPWSKKEFSPDCFSMEVFNPGNEKVIVLFSLRSGEKFFQKQLEIKPGYQLSHVMAEEMLGFLSSDDDYLVSLEVLSPEENVELLFGLLDFTKSKEENSFKSQEEVKKIKCIVWDLDNTLWEGVLLEDGEAGIKLRSDILDFIKVTDERGILHSIASKNNAEDALAVLKSMGLEDYFLYPQISWEPKSKAVSNIRRSLNIGMDTIAFIDDQIFERTEVLNSHPSIRVYDSLEFEEWRDNTDFEVQISSESKNRRRRYQDQAKREQFFEELEVSNYEEFLKDCEIRVRMTNLAEASLDRAYELAQRTNQMNFSGKRYSLSELKALTKDDRYSCKIVHCSDKFGEYGIVGLSIHDKSTNTVQDLMFSCRIQAKHVDKAVLMELLRQNGSDMKISYKETDKNSVSAGLFDEFGFNVLTEKDGVKLLGLNEGAEIRESTVVEVNYD